MADSTQSLAVMGVKNSVKIGQPQASEDSGKCNVRTNTSAGIRELTPPPSPEIESEEEAAQPTWKRNAKFLSRYLLRRDVSTTMEMSVSDLPFTDRLNVFRNKHLIAFKNGVYDLKEHGGSLGDTTHVQTHGSFVGGRSAWAMMRRKKN